MLALIRAIILAVFIIVIGVVGCVFCLFRPFRPDNTAIFSRMFGAMHKVIGIDMVIRIPESVKNKGPFVYVGNHQNSWDIFTMSGALQNGTVSIGKKSLKWIPFFGQLYWLAGNILIDRQNKNKAHSTISQAVQAIQSKGCSIWLFPEGTRSYGKGLLPFKTGAFHAVIAAQVPLVMSYMSTTHGQIKLNRWNNGKVILEMSEPIVTEGMTKENLRELMNQTYEAMYQGIARLDQEVLEYHQHIGLDDQRPILKSSDFDNE